MLTEHQTPALSKHNAKDLLRFITCGNVDDGKSTLVGRLLLEVGAIYDDQLEELKSESLKHGTVEGRIDTALLMDGLEDERQQGITIDVAYRYFTTGTRKFIIADTPGHEQFTRNMATGASSADLAIILVDATKGVTTQTKRHAFIVSLLGIRHVILAVNKMDLVGYSQTCAEKILRDFQAFSGELASSDVCLIPLSALNGDNVVAQSSHMTWYRGPTLLEQLQRVQIDRNTASASFRMPVQWVNRPDAQFRGFSGTIASGAVQVGDALTVLPSRKTALVTGIVTMDGKWDRAAESDSITLTLDRELDITRGDMLCSPEGLPAVSEYGQATLVWMSEQPLAPGKPYWCKHTARRTSCVVESIEYAIDVNTLQRHAAASLKLNEIGSCQLAFRDPLIFDPYAQNRETGSFILVDRITHETVAAGMLADPQQATSSGHWDQPSLLLKPQPAVSRISSEERTLRYGQQPLTVLITGLSSSGKTSVALAVEQKLFQAGRICVVLDGQTMRLGISRDLGFSAEERSENLRRAAEIAKLMNDAGQICIAAFVAPGEWVRQKARKLIGIQRFLHVHLSTPVEVCRQRDVTGQYRAADKGKLKNFPGVSVAYEQPLDADLTFNTETVSTEEIAEEILRLITSRDGLI